MFVVMSPSATEAEVLGVKSRILAEGLTPYEHATDQGLQLAVVGEVGDRRRPLMDLLADLPGVARVTPISRPFKLTSREFHPENTVIRVLDAAIGDGSLTVMAGPCSVESRGQLMETATAVRAAGATVLRGGAFKPRTSPYAFQGLGIEALRYLAEARDETGLPVVTEVMEPQPGRHRRRVRRHPPDRRPEHAELLAAELRGPRRPPDPPEARLRRDAGGAAHGRRVHRRPPATRT